MEPTDTDSGLRPNREVRGALPSRGRFGVRKAPGGLVAGVALVAVAGLTITVAASWAAWALDLHNERRLLDVQTRQAAALITAEIGNLTAPLKTSLQVAAATDGDSRQFSTYMATQVGPKLAFTAASLWRIDGSAPAVVSSVGAVPDSSPAVRDLLNESLRSQQFAVAGLPLGSMNRVAYALSDPKSRRFVVYAERAIPASRVVPVESNPAFSKLNFATYLGDSTRLTDLATTDRRLADLPIRGDMEKVKIAFGDTVVTLVTSRDGRLGGVLGAQLPWVFGTVGIAVTLSSCAVTVGLVRRRRQAEQDAGTITQLYERLGDRFGEQRHISETLQRALLPQRNPVVPGLEIASRYVSGTRGMEVGGDWYSIVPIDDRHFAFVVGDVSGRGLSAAAVMARLRFTLRAYLMEGHLPDRALVMCAREIDLIDDRHFATVLAGVGNLETREITLASAGHFSPLLLTDTTTEYVPTTVGVPLGVTPPSDYQLTSCVMPPGSAMVAFTDGLVERRGEDLLTGLNRLVRATSPRAESLDDTLTGILTAMGHDGSEDDVAILAFRWSDRPTGGHST